MTFGGSPTDRAGQRLSLVGNIFRHSDLGRTGGSIWGFGAISRRDGGLGGVPKGGMVGYASQMMNEAVEGASGDGQAMA